jgi:fatty-acyl-CoA synthase
MVDNAMGTMSYVSGASALPLIGETIGQRFCRTAARFADRLALAVRQQGVRLTWRELSEQVDKLAAGFLALGLERGDRSASGRPTTPNGC